MSYTNGSTPSSYPPTDDHSLMVAPETMESDVEDEVDQLDSDSDTAETETDSQNGSGLRIPGQTLLPPLRLENIISADGVTGNLALSKEGLFVLSVATEEFIKRMAQAAHLRASAQQRTTVNYNDMSATTQQYQEFMFLNETVPVPISIEEAIKLRKEKESSDADPSAPSPTPRPSISAPAPRKPKGRLNGTAPKHDRRSDKGLRPSSAPIDSDSTYSDWTDTRPPRTGGRPAISIYNGRLSLSARPSPLVNGHSASAAPSRSGTLTPAQSHDPSEIASPHHPPSASSAVSPFPAQQTEENWQGQGQPPYTGPASGFLQGPGGPFGHVAQNPGRTIYSQQFRAE